jgi:hypothetical protein
MLLTRRGYPLLTMANGPAVLVQLERSWLRRALHGRLVTRENSSIAVVRGCTWGAGTPQAAESPVTIASR